MDKRKKQIAGQDEPNFVKHSNSNFCIPIYKTLENVFQIIFLMVI